MRRHSSGRSRRSASDTAFSRVSIGSSDTPGRQLGVPRQLHRAHRRAPRRGRQHAAAGVGEEDRVDQLGLAARELRHESQHQPVARQALPQGIDLRSGRSVAQLVIGQEGRILLDRAVERATPVGEGVQSTRECGGHEPVKVASRTILAQPLSSNRHAIQLLTGPEAGSPHSAQPVLAAPAACGGRYRVWQRGQKKVDRCACTTRRTGVPHCTQGCPARP